LQVLSRYGQAASEASGDVVNKGLVGCCSRADIKMVTSGMII
jgi:hypothetical protein